ncbi:MAG: hypothetical protein ABIQ16_05640 [Polyangiaceae bacterium]
MISRLVLLRRESSRRQLQDREREGLAFDGALALAAAWVDRLGDAELDQLILDAKNTLLIREVMES